MRHIAHVFKTREQAEMYCYGLHVGFNFPRSGKQEHATMTADNADYFKLGLNDAFRIVRSVEKPLHEEIESMYQELTKQ